MTNIERLANKCTTTKCTKCPIWIFNNEGAGVGLHNNCVESMRFPTVAVAVNLWIHGKPFDKASLNALEFQTERSK